MVEAKSEIDFERWMRSEDIISGKRKFEGAVDRILDLGRVAGYNFWTDWIKKSGCTLPI